MPVQPFKKLVIPVKSAQKRAVFHAKAVAAPGIICKGVVCAGGFKGGCQTD